MLRLNVMESALPLKTNMTLLNFSFLCFHCSLLLRRQGVFTLSKEYSDRCLRRSYNSCDSILGKWPYHKHFTAGSTRSCEFSNYMQQTPELYKSQDVGPISNLETSRLMAIVYALTEITLHT